MRNGLTAYQTETTQSTFFPPSVEETHREINITENKLILKGEQKSGSAHTIKLFLKYI